MKKIFSLISVIFLLTGCTAREKDKNEELEGEKITQNAQLLELADVGDGIISAKIVNPWDTTETLGKYLLVDKHVADLDIPKVQGYEVIRVPIESAVVYSSVHTMPMEELGAREKIKGVADASYFTSEEIKEGLKSGKIIDVGNSMSPSMEKIVELSPEIALVSPYENSGHGVLEKTGVTVIDMADYMENTPLGRAEWILLLGALTGKFEDSVALYKDITNKYTKVKEKIAEIDNSALTLCELPYCGVWYQPGSRSYMARLIKDAGGRTILHNDQSVGSVQMDIANVYDQGAMADVWIIKSDTDLSLKRILAENKLASGIKAFEDRNVWFVNTSTSEFYNDLAFHPEKILEDYTKILHPEVVKGIPYYFQKSE